VSEHFDVIVVGTGAGGGSLAHTIAPTGKRILTDPAGRSLASSSITAETVRKRS